MIADILEALMLIAFGASWPVSILKTIQVKDPKGKSRIFLALVFGGYVCGAAAKLMRPRHDWVIVLYCINALMVLTDLVLIIYYSRRGRKGL